MDWKKKTAEIRCRYCAVGEKEIRMDSLTEPIDIYTEWIDSGREQNKKYNPQPQEIDPAELQYYRDQERIVPDDSALRRVSYGRDEGNTYSSDDSQLSSGQLESD
jgi:transcription elongation factor Elf1